MESRLSVLPVRTYKSLCIVIILYIRGSSGTIEHFKDVFTKGKADAALAASIFHFKEIAIPELKSYLRQQNIPIR